MYTKNKLSKFTQITMGVLISASIMSCGGNKQADSEDQQTTEDSSEPTATVEAEMQNYPLPSPLQIASIFKRAGMKYIDGVTNPISEAGKYSSNTSKALNLGVYSADLAYCTVNKQSQYSINYIKISRQIGAELGMASVFEANNLFARFEKNLSNEDSLTQIIAELQMQTDLFMEDNEQEHVAAIIFAGAWTESMYIGAKVFENQKDPRISSRLSEQMTILKNIVGVLKMYQTKDPAIASLVTDFSAIQDSYLVSPSVKALMADTTGAEIKLTDPELVSISAKIAELRAKVVKG